MGEGGGEGEFSVSVIRICFELIADAMLRTDFVLRI